MPGQVSPKVLVVSDDLSLLDEIVRHLEEMPHWHLVGSARSAAEMTTAMSAAQVPDAVLVTEGPARDLASGHAEFGSTRIVVVGREANVEVLRAALEINAKGFVLWPKEHRRLKTLVEEGLVAAVESVPMVKGRLTAIWSPKGGSGTTVLSAHLASLLAKDGTKCVLIDLDLDHGDLTAVVGVESHAKTILDLLRVSDEITASVLESVAWAHPDGFGVVLSPGSPGEAGLIKTSDLIAAVESVRELTDHVILDLPSGAGDLVFAAAEGADQLLLVVTPDLLSLRRSRDAMQALRTAGVDEARIEVVLNRSGGDISANDVATVLGRPVIAEIRPDVGLFKAPDRGELAKSAAKLLGPLARRISSNGPPAR